MPKLIDGEIRALLEAAELRLEYGTAEDRFRVAGVFHAVLGAGATQATLEWAVDYLRQDPAVHRPAPGAIPLPESADVPASVRDAYERDERGD